MPGESRRGKQRRRALGEACGSRGSLFPGSDQRMPHDAVECQIPDPVGGPPPLQGVSHGGPAQEPPFATAQEGHGLLLVQALFHGADSLGGKIGTLSKVQGEPGGNKVRRPHADRRGILHAANADGPSGQITEPIDGPWGQHDLRRLRPPLRMDAGRLGARSVPFLSEHVQFQEMR